MFSNAQPAKLKFIEPILTAAAEGNLAEVTRLLADNPALINFQENGENNKGFTPLMCACLNGHLKVVEFLLEKNANTTLRNDLGETALLLATNTEHLNIVRRLLDINKRNNAIATLDTPATNGFTPLISAIQHGNIRLFNLFMARNVNVNLPYSSNGSTPAMFAA